jgi:predicted nucleic acid-binding Zn ribbon protein
MTACAHCHAEIPPHVGKGRPRLYCTSCLPPGSGGPSIAAWRRLNPQKVADYNVARQLGPGGRGHYANTGGAPYPVPATRTPTAGESKSPTLPSTPDRRKCPVCGKAVAPVAIGRPRRFCSPECRRELPRLRRQLADLEAELAEARYQLSVREGAWRDSYARKVASLIPRVEAARQRIPEESHA